MDLVPRSRGFQVSRSRGGPTIKLRLPSDTILEDIPGSLHHLAYSRRSSASELDLRSLFSNAPLQVSGVLPWSLYERCLRSLLCELDRLSLNPMYNLMEDTRQAYSDEWTTLLCTFACYGDLLDMHCLAASQRLCDDLSRYIFQLLSRLVKYAPLPMVLNFVDLLEEKRFRDGMYHVWELLKSRNRKSWHKLNSSKGRINLVLSGEPSDRIVRFVKKQQRAELEDRLVEYGSSDLPFGLESLGSRVRMPNYHYSDDEIDYRRAARRGRRRHRFADFPFFEEI